MELLWFEENVGVLEHLSVCLCAMHEEEHSYLKFKAAFPSGYCVL